MALCSFDRAHYIPYAETLLLGLSHSKFVPMKKALILILLLALICVDISAQCPMCKIAAESNLENGGTAGKGLNTGILYMLSLPYLLIGLIGIIWYKNRHKEELPILD